MNFYNEHDPKAAAWLRELIADRLIPDGIVDERSITEIKSHELTHYTQCHFFAGIAGWSLALALAGWPATRPVWTGSCPCQPFSNAGKGLAQADERHLWPAFFNLIRECRPECVFGEQVESAIGKGWLDGIQTDLEGEGYALGSVVLGAHSLGAPHIRQRLFWVADSKHAEWRAELQEHGDAHRRDGFGGRGELGRLADAFLGGQRGRDERGLGAARQQVGEPENWARAANEPRDGREDAGSGGLGDAASGGRGERGNEAQPWCGGHPERAGRAGLGEWKQVSFAADCLGGDGDELGNECSVCGLDYSDGCQCPGPTQDGYEYQERDGILFGRLVQPIKPGLEGFTGTSDDGDQPGRERAVADGSASTAGAVGDFWADYTIIPCRDGKARRIESGTFPLVNGIPGGVVPSSDPSVSEAQATAESRVARLRGYGNAIVPQVAAEFVIAYLEIESEA